MSVSTHAWTADEIKIVKACLARVLDSDLFSQSERQSRFLRYIVEKTLAGEGNRIKQYSIGIDVFDRDDSFDPAIDSIVRVEAGRLRAKLREYYSDRGSEDGVLIEVRKGNYAAEFRFGENRPNVRPSKDVRPETGTGSGTIEDKPVVAVLAFANSSGDPEQEYFANGISEDIITDLSKFSGLAVIARQSSFRYKNKPVDTREIARQLGADYILEGNVRKAGNRVRISAQLVETGAITQIWAERYDHELGDIFSVQDDVTRKIITALQLTFHGDENVGLRANNTVSMEAYDCLLRGAEYARHSSHENVMQAQALYRRALSLDPDYAEACARLSRLYVYQWISGLDERGRVILYEAGELAKRAVQLNPASAFAHACLGWVYQWQEENDRALAEWHRAIDLDPSQADALSWLSLILSWSGQTQEARARLDCARRLNPLGKYYFPRGMIAYMNSEYEDAIHLFEKLLVQDPAFLPGHLFLASSYSIRGLPDQGRKSVNRILEINPDYRVAKNSRGGITVPKIRIRFRQSLAELGLPSLV